MCHVQKLHWFDFLLSAVLLAAACVLFVIRVSLVVWRHIKQPLYEGVDPEAMEPMEIAKKQKKIFRWAAL